MIGGIALLVIAHHHAATLGAHHDFVLGLLEVIHIDQTLATARRKQGSLVHQVGQICTGKTRRATGNNVSLDITSDWHLAHMDLENLFTATNIRQRHNNLAVKPARTQQCRIKNIRTIGCSDHDDAGMAFKAIHFDQ